MNDQAHRAQPSETAIRKKTLFAEIAEAVRAKSPPARISTKIVAIDGLGGAGKSSLASLVALELGNAPIVHTDDFASWDHPLDWWPRLVRELLEPLAHGQVARYRRTSWSDEDEDQWTEVAPAAFVLLEGVSASREAFRPFLTYSLWVETPRELRLERGLDRDGEEARALWERWMEEEDGYVALERPQAWADRVLAGDENLWR